MPTRVRTLTAALNLARASHYGYHANEVFASYLGVPSLPCAPWHATKPGGSHGTRRGIGHWIGDRPLALVNHYALDLWDDWAAQRAVPTMVIRPDPRTGLNDEDVERLLAFARPINAAAADPSKLAHYVPRFRAHPDARPNAAGASLCGP